jgi:hypothetical protein
MRAMIRPGSTLPVLCMLLAGCANFSAEQCRSADWYSLGAQDAYLYGLPPQITAMAHECQKVGVQVPEKAYLDGWAAGERERAMRTFKSL